MNHASQAVIFDLDGTLIDSFADLAGATNWMLEQLGQPTHPLADYQLKIGAGLPNLVRQALPPDRADLVPRGLDLAKRRYAEVMLDTTHVYPGVAELLDALTDQGLPIAILTNKPQTATLQVVDSLLSRWSFGAIRGVGDDGITKPDPRGALAITDQMGVPASGGLLVGDSNIDIATAKAAAMVGVGVTWGFRSRKELEAAGADRIIEHPSELLRLLE